MWCPWTPGRPQGPSRLSVGIGLAKWHDPQISSISCRSVLESCCPKQNAVAR